MTAYEGRAPAGSVCSAMQVQRLTAYARLDETSPILAFARSEAELGDESWAQWVSEFDRREAVIVRLDLTIEISEGAPGELRGSTRGFFVERTISAPTLEQQIAEVARDELVAMARGNADWPDHQIDPAELETGYIDVELDDDLRGWLASTR